MDAESENKGRQFRRHTYPDHWVVVHQRGAFGFLNPTHVRFHDDRANVGIDWDSRSHRKGRFAQTWHLHHGPRRHLLGPWRGGWFGGLLPRLWGWDTSSISWWVAILFLLGSMVWCVNGWFALFSPRSEQVNTYVEGYSGLLGGTFFEAGALLLVLEALNSAVQVRPGHAPELKDASSEVEEGSRGRSSTGEPHQSTTERQGALQQQQRQLPPVSSKAVGMDVEEGLEGVSLSAAVGQPLQPPPLSTKPLSPGAMLSPSGLSPVVALSPAGVALLPVADTKPALLATACPLAHHTSSSALSSTAASQGKAPESKQQEATLGHTVMSAAEHPFVVLGFLPHDLGFLASFVNWLAATVFWIATFTGVPNALPEPEAEGHYALWDGVFWVPQVVGGVGFVISGMMFMLETQKHWWQPSLLKIGWHVGFWNWIGGIGFLLCGIFGLFAEPNPNEELQRWGTAMSTFWGSWAFLLGSYLQLLETLNPHCA